MPSNESERCPGCGAEGPQAVHAVDCPTQKITITDKRGQKKVGPEIERLLKEGQETHREALDTLAESTRLDKEAASKLTANRAARIEELKENIRTVNPLDGELDAWNEELLRLQAEEDAAQDDVNADAPRGIDAYTAFLVYIDHTGKVVATSDCSTDLVIDREATIDDMYGAAATVMRDIQAAATTGQVVFGLSVSAQAMKEKNAAMQMASQLQAGAMPGGNRASRRR